MSYHHRKAHITFEMPEQFFKNLQVPPGWQLIGRNDIGGSIGYIYLVKSNVYIRVYYHNAWLGGICKKDTSENPPSYKSIASNKQSAQMNEFLQELIII